MQKSIVRVKQTCSLTLPVECIPGRDYVVLVETDTHVKLAGIEQYVSKASVDFIEPSDSFYDVVEERTVTFKVYSNRRVKNGIPIGTGIHDDSIAVLVSDVHEPLFKSNSLQTIADIETSYGNKVFRLNRI